MHVEHKNVQREKFDEMEQIEKRHRLVPVVIFVSDIIIISFGSFRCFLAVIDRWERDGSRYEEHQKKNFN